MTTFNPETGDILSQLKTFKTLCAAFSARVRELNGEYGLWKIVPFVKTEVSLRVHSYCQNNMYIGLLRGCFFYQTMNSF